MRFLFAPIGIVAGLIAGSIAQKAFERLWAVFDDEEPPAPERRPDRTHVEEGRRIAIVEHDTVHSTCPPASLGVAGRYQPTGDGQR